MDRIAVYTGTRNIYSDMETAVKSLIANSAVDKVFLMIEDDEFPSELPPFVEHFNIANQKFFPTKGANSKTKYTYMTLIRCALHRLFPEYDKVLSLDCDTICIQDITKIWDIDISDSYFSASQELLGAERGGFCYCNVGVTLWNLDRLRKTGKGDEFIRVLNTHEFSWPDQDVANYLCQGFIKPMPSGYNACDFIIDDGSVTRILHYAARNDWRNEPEVLKYRDMSWDEVLDRHSKVYKKWNK